MIIKKENQLLKFIEYFFQSYLPQERGLSLHTIRSYRDTLKLFLQYISKTKKYRGLQSVGLEEITAENVKNFLNWIEKLRNNSISTRNQRLAVIKTFVNFLTTQDIARGHQFEKISLMTMKRVPYKPVVYLTDNEIHALLDSVDQNTNQGLRDYAILLMLYNSGARVQELCDLKIKDIRIEKPFMVTLVGKGQKTRQVPLWGGTITAIKKYLEITPSSNPDSPIFIGKRSEPLSRFAVRYLVQAYVAKAIEKCKSLQDKDIGPHTFRHTTAMHLLQSGVDIAVIKEWLGHADLNTTHEYVEINMKMKEAALAKTTSPKKTHKSISSILKQEKDVLKWLEAI